MSKRSLNYRFHGAGIYPVIRLVEETIMLESFITAFIVYFVVIDPVGNAPIFLAVTQHLDRAAKTRTALECSLVAFWHHAVFCVMW